MPDWSLLLNFAVISATAATAKAAKLISARYAQKVPARHVKPRYSNRYHHCHIAGQPLAPTNGLLADDAYESVNLDLQKPSVTLFCFFDERPHYPYLPSKSSVKNHCLAALRLTLCLQ